MYEKISIHDAYRAMFVFLEREYELTHSDDLGGLLGSLQLLNDGKPADPAAWMQWLDAVRRCQTSSEK
jgi:hypothetical protein